MGWYVYKSEINDGKPITCEQCHETVNDGDTVYFIEMQPLKVEHTSCLEDRIDAERKVL